METKDPEMSSAGVRAWKFLTAFVREPLKVGAIWPSSPQLSQCVAEACEFSRGDTVVELGPGTGNFTELLLPRLDPSGRLVALELSETNVRVLQRRFPRGEMVFDSAEHLGRYVAPRRARCVVSGLAWGNMRAALQHRIMDAVVAALAPGGQFVAFAYVHARWFPTTLHFRRRMFRDFARVETTPIIWRNLPPAYVYRCWRTGGATPTLNA